AGRRARTDNLRPAVDADRAAAGHQPLALRHRDGHRDGVGAVCAADRPGPVCDLCDHPHASSKRGAPDVQIPGRAARDADRPGARALVLLVAAEPVWPVVVNTNLSIHMTTIQDVARRAAVSVSTVSNVLNGRGDRMRPATLARVEAAIATLQFRPSKSAQQLKTGQTPLLGLLVPSMANPMYGYIAREVETFAQERFGYRLLIGSTYRDAAKEAAFFEDLRAHGVRHVIVISSLAEERHLDSAVARGMNVMSYDRRAAPGRPSAVGHVTPDNFEAARLATGHLIAKGHTRLAFATVAGMTMSRSDKIEGFFAAADAAGLRASAKGLDGGALNENGDSGVGQGR